MLIKKETGWNKYKEEEKKWAMEFSEYYKKFIDKSKTEREFVENAITLAEKKGFKKAESFDTLEPGDKIYYVNRNKNLILAVIGKKDIEKGVKIIASHIDSPRLDLKQRPLYEDSDLALLKTHYYGGIKKYQWAAIPLAIHGVVILADGKKVNITIGEDDNDPVFVISDLLPHLSKNAQDDRKSRDVIKGEELVVIIGSIPSKITDKEVKEKIKYAVIEKLNEQYGMKEEDFFSAEIEIVPAFKARDIGLDRGLVGSYGHDDKICGYTSLIAILDIAEENTAPDSTIICYLADKEEIGSTGATGLESKYIEYFMSDIIFKMKENYSDIMLKRCLWASSAISADVTAGIDPQFKSVHDEQNAAKLGYGIAISKYTGHGGKYGSNDADAEYVAEIRSLFNRENILWQSAGLGKIDEGGGGTVAKFLSNYGIKTIDAGPALLSMHSPFEIASKLDIFESFRAYKAFYKA